MEVFDKRTFTQAIKQTLEDNMPVESETLFKRKHKGRAGQMKQLALGNNSVIPLLGGDYYFEIGNPLAEKETPQYHILEDAEVIHLANKGTKTSKGSQANVKDLSQRDYGRISIKVVKGKTRLYNEYRKSNLRGSRSKVDRARKVVYNGKKKIIINPNARYYANKHYHYIENILDKNIDNIASSFGLKRGRNRKTTLEQDLTFNNFVDMKEKMLKGEIGKIKE